MKVHFIGIGGSGLSAIALYLLEKGIEVSGSDLVISPEAERLTRLGGIIHRGHDGRFVEGVDLVVRSSAIPEDNVEVLAAQEFGVPVLKRAEYLGEILSDSFSIAIAGTHGKTTTSSMLAWLLTALNQDPSFIVGGIIENLSANAHAGTGPAFVIEADEYDHMFLGLNPDLAVITNVEFDHPDLFPDSNTYFTAFAQFIDKIKPGGQILVCKDDPGAARLIERAHGRGLKVRTYGIAGNSDYVGDDIREGTNGGPIFGFRRGDDLYARVSLQIPGVHNVQNAVAALAVLDILDLSVTEGAQALRDFRGARRRFQIRGSAGGVVVVDDYAHHPSEIQATISAAHSQFPQSRVWAVWQPHTYFRSRMFFDDFIRSFDQADGVVVTEIYAAREQIPDDFSGHDLVQAMAHPNVVFKPDFDMAVDYLVDNVLPGDLVVILSAGDAVEIAGELLAALDHPGAGRPALNSKSYRTSPVI